MQLGIRLGCVVLVAANVARSRNKELLQRFGKLASFSLCKARYLLISLQRQPTMTKVTSLEEIYQILDSTFWCHKMLFATFYKCIQTLCKTSEIPL